MATPETTEAPHQDKAEDEEEDELLLSPHKREAYQDDQYQPLAVTGTGTATKSKGPLDLMFARQRLQQSLGGFTTPTKALRKPRNTRSASDNTIPTSPTKASAMKPSCSTPHLDLSALATPRFRTPLKIPLQITALSMPQELPRQEEILETEMVETTVRSPDAGSVRSTPRMERASRPPPIVTYPSTSSPPRATELLSVDLPSDAPSVEVEEEAAFSIPPSSPLSPLTPLSSTPEPHEFETEDSTQDALDAIHTKQDDVNSPQVVVTQIVVDEPSEDISRPPIVNVSATKPGHGPRQSRTSALTPRQQPPLQRQQQTQKTIGGLLATKRPSTLAPTSPLTELPTTPAQPRSQTSLHLTPGAKSLLVPAGPSQIPRLSPHLPSSRTQPFGDLMSGITGGPRRAGRIHQMRGKNSRGITGMMSGRSSSLRMGVSRPKPLSTRPSYARSLVNVHAARAPSPAKPETTLGVQPDDKSSQISSQVNGVPASHSLSRSRATTAEPEAINALGKRSVTCPSLSPGPPPKRRLLARIEDTNVSQSNATSLYSQVAKPATNIFPRTKPVTQAKLSFPTTNPATPSSSRLLSTSPFKFRTDDMSAPWSPVYPPPITDEKAKAQSRTLLRSMSDTLHKLALPPPAQAARPPPSKPNGSPVRPPTSTSSSTTQKTLPPMRFALNGRSSTDKKDKPVAKPRSSLADFGFFRKPPPKEKKTPVLQTVDEGAALASTIQEEPETPVQGGRETQAAAGPSSLPMPPPATIPVHVPQSAPDSQVPTTDTPDDNVAGARILRKTSTRGKLPVDKLPLHDCVVFVDVRTEQGEDSKSLFVDMLRELGAKILTRVGQSCTHIIYKNGLASTVTRYRLLNEPRPAFVGIGWVVSCVEKRSRVDENEFNVALEDVGFIRNVKRPRSTLRRSIFQNTDEASPAAGAAEDSFTSSQEGSRSMDSLPPLERARRRSIAIPRT